MHFFIQEKAWTDSVTETRGLGEGGVELREKDKEKQTKIESIYFPEKNTT